ncbi:MAG: phosphate ABC transporter permease PstA [Planctomycetia bacterium]
MSIPNLEAPSAVASAPTGLAGRRPRSGVSLQANGEAMIWLTGGAVVLAFVMIVGLLVLIVFQGVGTFWPGPLYAVALRDGGKTVLGEVTKTETYRPTVDLYDRLPESLRDVARGEIEQAGGVARRRLFRTGNFELTGIHYQWVHDFEIAEETKPEWGVVIERTTWGRFYGTPVGFLVDGQATASAPADVWAKYQEHHGEVRALAAEARGISSGEIGAINRRLEHARLGVQAATAAAKADPKAGAAGLDAAKQQFAAVQKQADGELAGITTRLAELKKRGDRYAMVMKIGDGREKTLSLAEIVRAIPANQLTTSGKSAVYGSRWAEFLTADPREANSEGGVFPAIFGTVVMTLLMTIAVVPFGVMAALYLREYAKGGWAVSLVRIAVNNLAGVPSIVFGVFGLGFFCYMIGASIDDLLFAARLPNPTYGKGGVLWAALTLALLTVPVVIVATEEALSAVPNSMREGSYACGASKWQTIRRIVLPRAMPGIMTGVILAMARGAGEVAPLMLVGAVKLAPELPIDAVAPFIHPERSFMHLGFHIYDLGFQSANSEAAKPMVYTTTLLLITVIAILNIAAVQLRIRLRKKYATSKF